MKIKISSLTDGTYEYHFEDDVKKLDLEHPFVGKYITKVNLSKYLNQIILEAATTVDAEFECDRCVKIYSAQIESRYKMVYLHNQPEGDDDSVDVTYLTKDADKIDITDDVRDYLLLAVPIKKLCKEDCKGLCPRCGKNLNDGQCSCKPEEVDARWKPLLELKNKLN
ncbi:MAG: DUF177 domain-containing protein [Ignavibacteriales bacterium]|nr:DUF177 domain-containing protein [Ignavibacteriales bacterium]